MKVYLQPPQPSLGLQRIADALTRWAPVGVEVVPAEDLADLVVIYAIGRRDHIQRQVERLLSANKKYTVIQVCLRSTLSPDTRDWINIWKNAAVLWSYYDLFTAAMEDGIWVQGMSNFFHSPLGADPNTFRYVERDYRYSHGGNGYVILTSGPSRLQESVRECELAAEIVDRHMFHLGRKVTGRSHVTCLTNITDEQLARVLSTCEFVSGLRRTEGFELPAVEGLLCGARPIVFDTPDYRFNYREFAEYIKEGTRQEVVDQLVELFKQGARPVTPAEREEAAHWFNWERIVGEFWSRCL